MSQGGYTARAGGWTYQGQDELDVVEAAATVRRIGAYAGVLARDFGFTACPSNGGASGNPSNSAAAGNPSNGAAGFARQLYQNYSDPVRAGAQRGVARLPAPAPDCTPITLFVARVADVSTTDNPL